MRKFRERRRVVSLVAMALALVLALAACGDDEEETGAAETVTETETAEDATETTAEEPAPGPSAAPKAAKVEIVDFAFEPATVTVQVDGKVNWANEDTAPHTATAEDGSFDTGTIETDKRGNATFKEAGTFPYICDIHPEMKGTVEVVEG